MQSSNSWVKIAIYTQIQVKSTSSFNLDHIDGDQIFSTFFNEITPFFFWWSQENSLRSQLKKKRLRSQGYPTKVNMGFSLHIINPTISEKKAWDRESWRFLSYIVIFPEISNNYSIGNLSFFEANLVKLMHLGLHHVTLKIFLTDFRSIQKNLSKLIFETLRPQMSNFLKNPVF